jgi:hypothetical protein
MCHCSLRDGHSPEQRRVALLGRGDDLVEEAYRGLVVALSRAALVPC